MHSGILCLNKKVITVLGGVVQSLYDEWQLKRKYMNVSRYKLRSSQENASSYPPPFEKLQVRALGRGTSSTSYTPSSEGMHFQYMLQCRDQVEFTFHLNSFKLRK